MNTIGQFSLQQIGWFEAEVSCQYLVNGQLNRARNSEPLPQETSKTISLGDLGVPDGAAVYLYEPESHAMADDLAQRLVAASLADAEALLASLGMSAQGLSVARAAVLRQ